jgi:hypothetical protein
LGAGFVASLSLSFADPEVEDLPRVVDRVLHDGVLREREELLGDRGVGLRLLLGEELGVVLGVAGEAGGSEAEEGGGDGEGDGASLHEVPQTDHHGCYETRSSEKSAHPGRHAAKAWSARDLGSSQPDRLGTLRTRHDAALPS